MSRTVLRLSAGFLVGALALLAASLYLSDHYVEEGRELAAAGDVESAVETSRTAARLDPFGAEPLRSRFFILQQQERTQDAEAALESAIQREPNSYELYLLLGNFQRGELGDLEAAIESYRKALELNPNSTRARIALARVLVRAGNLQEAKKQYERLQGMGRLAIQDLYDLGRIQVRTGEPGKGAKTIKTARQQAKAGLDELTGAERQRRVELIESMGLAVADARVVQRRYGRAHYLVSQSSAEQAPAIMQLLRMSPEAYRQTVLDSEIY